MKKMISHKCSVCGKEIYLAEKATKPLCVECFKAKLEAEREAARK